MRLLRRQAEAGFTLAELLVAMTLTGVLIAAVAPVINNLASATRTTRFQGSSSADTRNAVGLFQHDVSRMRAPDRNDTRLGAIADLNTVDPCTDVECPGRHHDVTVARPVSFKFWADVMPDVPGVESVVWELYQGMTTVGDGRYQWRLTRTVRPELNPGRDDKPILTEIMAWGHGDLPEDTMSACPEPSGAIIQRVFCFKEMVVGNGAPANYSWAAWKTNDCNEAWGGEFNLLPSVSYWGTSTKIPAGHQNPAAGLPATSFWSMDRISEVGLIVPGQSGGITDTGNAMRIHWAGIRSRLTGSYQSAIMCGGR